MAQEIEMNEAEAEELHKISAYAMVGDFTLVFVQLDQLRSLHRLVNVIPKPLRFKGFALLHWAAFHGNCDAISRLVTEYGAKLDLKTSPADGGDPVDAQELTCMCGHGMAFAYLASLCDTDGHRLAAEPPSTGVEPSAKRSRFGDVKGSNKQINNKNYKMELLRLAEDAKLVTRDVAERLWKLAKQSGGRVTETECRTLWYILDGMPLEGKPPGCHIEKDADEYLREHLEEEVHEEAMQQETAQHIDIAVIEPAAKGARKVKLSGLLGTMAAAPETPKVSASKAAGKAKGIPSPKSAGKAAKTSTLDASPSPKAAKVTKSAPLVLLKGDEVKIVTKKAGGRKVVQFYRVHSLQDDMLNIGELIDSLDKDSQLLKANQRPLNWQKTLGGMTKAFKDFVVNFNRDKQCSCEQLLQGMWNKNEHKDYTRVFPHGDGKLPTERKALQKSVLYAYTADTPNLYSHVTMPLRSNSRCEMAKWAGLIRELQECFRSGQEGGLLTPFKGKVWRFETLFKHDLEQLMTRFKKNETVTYASFTSTTSRKKNIGAFSQGRNVEYEIICHENGSPKEGYFPADIHNYSKFAGPSGEAEVLFPSQCKLRIVNLSKSPGPDSKLTIHMETTEWPSVWDMIEKKQWKEVDTYAFKHKELIQVKGAQHSILGAVAKVCEENPEEDNSEGIRILYSNGADLDEVDPDTENPVVRNLVEAFATAKKTGKPIPKGLDRAVEKLGEYEAKAARGYYKQDHGVKYVSALLDIAENQKMIGKDAVHVLAEQACKGRGMTRNKRVTLEKILTGELPPRERRGDPIKIRLTFRGQEDLKQFLKENPVPE